MIYHYIQFWKRAFDFKGVASRPQYWYAVLANFIVLIAISVFWLIIDAVLWMMLGLVEASYVLEGVYGFIMGLYSLAMLIPSISITIRRLHDRNLSGWLYLVSLIPLGGLVIFVFTCMATVRHNNRWRMYDIRRGYIRDDMFSNLSGYGYQDPEYNYNGYQNTQSTGDWVYKEYNYKENK